ncbi:hypothetical protein OsI_10692 [Oryza sativa Indica Group]|jgi:hypothetical protein|uniref:Uncharacterized protein n=1 Tax=Oryza sativa subsp. indica TaxID=39946 RepID=A2XED5_ORYSI|nr:hypothetical protein OsI_10692 [Oryza sativa Indica Group]
MEVRGADRAGEAEEAGGEAGAAGAGLGGGGAGAAQPRAGAAADERKEDGEGKGVGGRRDERKEDGEGRTLASLARGTPSCARSRRRLPLAHEVAAAALSLDFALIVKGKNRIR